MAEFPYTPRPSSLPDFLETIQSTGKPVKVTLKYIAALGFMSSNDRYISGILKSLGFTDPSGIPTERWQAYRDKKRASAELATAIREAYSGLFALYPDAYRKDNEALRNFFTSDATVGEKAVSYMVNTFKTLCELADFASASLPSAPPVSASKPLAPAPGGAAAAKLTETIVTPQGVTTNVNIQLTLPETKDSSIYDRFFESLKTHLLS